MSVYDENRRKCNRCGKMINHWEDNDCDKGLCKIPDTKKSTRIESVYGFNAETADVDFPDFGNRSPKDTKKMGLFDELEKHIRQEIVEELFEKGESLYQETLTKVKNDLTLSSEYLSSNLRFAESLKTAAKFLSDPQDYS